MAGATVATAICGALVGRRGAAALAVFLTFFHAGLHVFAFATGLGILFFAFFFVAAGYSIFAFGFGVMATTLAIFHVVHVMAAALGFGSGGRVGGGWGLVSLCPHHKRQRQDQSKHS